VFLNLIVNAAHAIGERVRDSSDRGVITLRTRLEGGVVIVHVSDTGVGIPVTLREKIFDPFFTTKPVGVGTGQGLTIARSIVVKHGGTLTFESEPGKGTTFEIRLPVPNDWASE
jgi:two-component system NtrC family sensor kinase